MDIITKKTLHPHSYTGTPSQREGCLCIIRRPFMLLPCMIFGRQRAKCILIADCIVWIRIPPIVVASDPPISPLPSPALHHSCIHRMKWLEYSPSSCTHEEFTEVHVHYTIIFVCKGIVRFVYLQIIQRNVLYFTDPKLYINCYTWPKDVTLKETKWWNKSNIFVVIKLTKI